MEKKPSVAEEKENPVGGISDICAADFWNNFVIKLFKIKVLTFLCVHDYVR